MRACLVLVAFSCHSFSFTLFSRFLQFIIIAFIDWLLAIVNLFVLLLFYRDLSAIAAYVGLTGLIVFLVCNHTGTYTQCKHPHACCTHAHAQTAMQRDHQQKHTSSMTFSRAFFSSPLLSLLCRSSSSRLLLFLLTFSSPDPFSSFLLSCFLPFFSFFSLLPHILHMTVVASRSAGAALLLPLLRNHQHNNNNNNSDDNHNNNNANEQNNSSNNDSNERKKPK